MPHRRRRAEPAAIRRARAPAPPDAPPPHGDEAEFFERHAADLHRAVRGRVIAPPALIEDACSFAWTQLLRHQPDRKTAFGWLVTVATREAYRLHAQATRPPPTIRALPDSSADPPASAELRERLGELARTLERRQTRVVGLQAAGFSYAEIAGMTGDSIRTVARLLQRARAATRDAA